MFQNIERVKMFSKVFTVIAVILAFLAGVTGLLAPIESITCVATWLTAGLAFLSAFLGVATLLLDNQEDALEDKIKRTPPSLDVSIKTGQEDQKLYVVIEPKNTIPFQYNWRIVTREDKVISGIMLDWNEVHPSANQPYYTTLARMNFDSIVDDYIELRFDYRSITFAEFHDPDLVGCQANIDR